MKYLPHLKANLRVSWKAFLLMIFHLLHGIFPCKWTEHEHWKINLDA